MSFFSTGDRINIIDKISHCVKANADILSLMIVGSGASGFKDEFSDLDFCLVIKNKENMTSIMEYTKKCITSVENILYFSQMEQRGLQVYLLSSFLEIDIGFMPIDEVIARRGEWKVIIDKIGNVAKLMESSWEKGQKINHGKTSAIDKDAIYNKYANNIWHFLFHATIAIKRGDNGVPLAKLNRLEIC